MPSNDDLPFIDGDQMRAAVPMADMLDSVEAAYRDVADGRDRSPLRSHVKLSDGALLLMPGVREGGAGASVKLVTVMPKNTERGLPTIHALLVWLDAATGRPTALLDGAAMTAMRTGAASGVATRLLGRTDAETLAVIGAGGQAEWQIRAVLVARSIRRVRVFARDAARRDAFAARMSASTGIEVSGAASAEAALAEADVVCCATTSAEPVFEAAWVKPGAHVNGIGAYHLGMVELPPELFARAAVVTVDSLAAALAEAGDVVAAIDEGFMRSDDLVEIGAVHRAWVEARDPNAITVFKSVGMAIQDVAAAELIVARLLGAPTRG